MMMMMSLDKHTRNSVTHRTVQDEERRAGSIHCTGGGGTGWTDRDEMNVIDRDIRLVWRRSDKLLSG